jgi:hypothetical protein
MMPVVSLPAGGKVRTPVDLKLKPNWRFDASRRVFVSGSGKEFAPCGELPRRSRIVYKVPGLVGADEAQLSKYEKDLRRYMQVILPAGKSPAEYVAVVRAWPCTAEAHVAPELSLPENV